MTWVFAILVVLVLGGVAVLAAGRGGPLAPAAYDDPGPGVPDDGLLTSTDLRSVRFPLAVRGYRMADVDALLDRLAVERADERAAPPAAAEEPPRGEEHAQ